MKQTAVTVFLIVSTVMLVDATVDASPDTTLPDITLPTSTSGPLTGRILIADPSLDGSYFGRTVVFVADHDDDGAFGLVINRSFGSTSLVDLLPRHLLTDLPEDLQEAPIPIHVGGPVERGAGFVLHTRDYAAEDTRHVGSDLALTTDIEILLDLAKGDGPAEALVAIGYAGWSPGQLEREIDRGSWTVLIADTHFIFNTDRRLLWQEAVDRLGEDI